MICDQCQEDKSNKDFYKSTVCYKCTFRNKKLNYKQDCKKKSCKICNNFIPEENLVYWKACYCSEDCAKQGKDYHNKNYWIRNCTAPPSNRGFNYGKSKQI